MQKAAPWIAVGAVVVLVMLLIADIVIVSKLRTEVSALAAQVKAMPNTQMGRPVRPQLRQASHAKGDQGSPATALPMTRRRKKSARRQGSREARTRPAPLA